MMGSTCAKETLCTDLKNALQILATPVLRYWSERAVTKQDRNTSYSDICPACPGLSHMLLEGERNYTLLPPGWPAHCIQLSQPRVHPLKPTTPSSGWFLEAGQAHLYSASTCLASPSHTPQASSFPEVQHSPS